LVFLIFGKKGDWLKVAYKLLVKLNIGVNFPNILSAAFSNESALYIFSLLAFWLSNFFGKIMSSQKLLIKCW